MHHGFVQQPGDWPHSSWSAYKSKKPTKIMKSEAMEWFGSIEKITDIYKELNHQKMMTLIEAN